MHYSDTDVKIAAETTMRLPFAFFITRHVAPLFNIERVNESVAA